MKLSHLSLAFITVGFLTAQAIALSPARLQVLRVTPTGLPARAPETGHALISFEGALAKLQTEPAHPDGIEIMLEDGVYPISETLEPSAADSTRNHITLKAAHPGKAVLDAGIHVPASAWHEIEDEATLKRLAPEARGKVLALDLAKLGVKHTKTLPDLFADNGGLIELHCNDAKQPLSRWPNDADTVIAKVLDKGVFTGKDKRGGVFAYNGDRPNRWTQAATDGQLWVAGFWRVPWDFQAVRVKTLDTDKRAITLAGIVGGGIGSKYAGLEGAGTEPWHAINLLEEIDQPGEWSVDLARQVLYWWPSAPIKQADVVLNDLSDPLVRLNGASHVTLRGLVLQGGLGNGIEITNGDSCSIEACEFKSLSKNGVVISGGERHRVMSCDLHHLGQGGIIISGGDRKALKPCGHIADNNDIHDYALAKLNYSPGIGVGFYLVCPPAIGCTITHNRIHGSPHAGVLYGGNDNLFEFNEVYDVVNKTDDMGAFYTTHEWISGGNIVRHNFVHHATHATGYYMDDGDCGDLIEGNISLHIICGPFIGGGHDNIARDNISIACGRGAHLDTRGVARGYDKDQALMKGLKSIDAEAPPWKDRFPNLSTLFGGHPELPTGCLIERTIAVDCESVLHTGGKKDELKVAAFRDNLELSMEDMGFMDAAKLDFRMKPFAPVLKKLPGFKPIPFEKIGLQVNDLRPTLPIREAKFSRMMTEADKAEDKAKRR